jgi:outer membrane lipopolysaccharide assembly protein LptE/RlpB
MTTRLTTALATTATTLLASCLVALPAGAVNVVWA